MTKKKILCGLGEVEIDGVSIGLTRGGATFTVENEIREINADGDRGRVKDRVVNDTIRPKLEVNALEVNKASMQKYFAGLSVGSSGKITSVFDFSDGDYHTVTWTGKTLDGKSCVIELTNAINTENIDLSLQEKDEAVATLTFEGCYEEGSEVVPYTITFAD